MIRITRNLMVGGLLSLAILTVTNVLAVLPARADYQSGVDAYYKGDFTTAYNEWLPLAEAGDAVAQNSLGALYDHGLGVTEDNAEAVRWYEMAAQQGLPLAMRNLGNQYATGHGVPFDLEAAKQWYERAAAAGDQQSAALLNHLRPAAPPPSDSAAATPVFSTPNVTGNLAEPAEGTIAAAPDVAGTVGSDDLVIADAPAAPAQAAPDASAPIALDLGNETVTMPATGVSATEVQPAPVQPATATETATQQAAVIPAPPASPRTDGNWLVGQWQGPSLGCPKGGGIEFTDAETLSWFDGQVAVRLSTSYKISGDNIVVIATGGDGVPQEYTYQRSGPDKMIIVSIPPTMPKSLLGIAYRRCGPAPAVTQSAAAPGTAAPAAIEPSPVPAATPIIAPSAATSAISTPAASTAAASTAAASTAAATTGTEYSIADVPEGSVTAAAGWKAFEDGQYEQALGIFKSLGEAGDTNMQVIVGNIYDYGQGVPQDDVQALQWYLMAAERGNGKGQYQAGVLYYRSQSVPQDLIESYRWLTLAAEGPSPGMASDPAQATGVQARSLLGEVAAGMSAGDIAKAKALVKKTRKKS